jgi:hypothetical protein
MSLGEHLRILNEKFLMKNFDGTNIRLRLKNNQLPSKETLDLLLENRVTSSETMEITGEYLYYYRTTGEIKELFEFVRQRYSTFSKRRELPDLTHAITIKDTLDFLKYISEEISMCRITINTQSLFHIDFETKIHILLITQALL